jgi:hypothetical protein
MTSRCFELKQPDVSVEDMLIMKPSLIIVWGFLSKFCLDNNLPCRITNIKTKFPESISDTHPQGRAIDVSVKDWSILHVQDCLEYLRRNVGHLGAIVGRGDRKVALHHDIGRGAHLHIQVAPEEYNEID